MNMRLKLFWILSLLLFYTSSLFSQENKPRVSVIPLFTQDGNSILTSLGNTVIETAELTLRLLDRYEIYAEDEAPPTDMKQMEVFAERKNIDSVIFGEINAEDDGTYTITLNVYDRASGSLTITREVLADSILDIFDATDTLVPELISGFSGQHIGYGSLTFRNTGFDAPYIVYINHALVGTNVTMIPKLLYGSHTIRLTALRDREIELLREDFYLDEGGEVSFAFDIPYLTEETMQKLGQAEEIVFLGMDKTARRQLVHEEILELQQMVKTYSQSLSLDELKLKANELRKASYRSYIYRTEILPVADIQIDGNSDDWENIREFIEMKNHLLTGKVPTPIPAGYEPEYFKVALSPDGKYLQFSMRMKDENILWDYAHVTLKFDDHEKQLSIYKEAGRWYTSVEWTPPWKSGYDGSNNKMIYSGRRDAAVKDRFCEYRIPLEEAEMGNSASGGVWINDNENPADSWYPIPSITLKQNELYSPQLPENQAGIINRQRNLLDSYDQIKLYEEE
jgi:hypothetical protein